MCIFTDLRTIYFGYEIILNLILFNKHAKNEKYNFLRQSSFKWHHTLYYFIKKTQTIQNKKEKT